MDEVLAAAERRRRIAGLDMSGVECGWIVEQDAYVLADAYLAEHQADDGERITTIDHAVACGGERYSGSYLNIVLFYAGLLCVTWDSDCDRWQLGPVVIWQDYSPTRGQLRQLLKAIGGGDGK